MDAPVIGYVRIFCNSLTGSQGVIYIQFGLKRCLLLLKFTTILWIFWDLGLTSLNIPKDVPFLEILVLSNIFGFLAVNWAQKWTKTLNSEFISFETKFKILKDFPSNMFVLLEGYIWSGSQQDQTIFGGAKPKCPKIDHFMDTESIRKILKTFNFTTTNAIPMKRTTDIYLTKVFHLPKSLGVARRV